MTLSKPFRIDAALRVEEAIDAHVAAYGPYVTQSMIAGVWGSLGYPPVNLANWDASKLNELTRRLEEDMDEFKPRSSKEMVQVTFTGPQGCGKTILAGWLEYQLELRGIKTVMTPFRMHDEYCDMLEVRLNGTNHADLYIETFPGLIDEPRHRGVGIVIFPLNWRLGFVRRKDTKVVFSLGPVRFCWHKVGDK